MKKYRIFESCSSDGERYYYIKQKVLWLFWVYIMDGLETWAGRHEWIKPFKSIEDAKKYIKELEKPGEVIKKDKIVMEI